MNETEPKARHGVQSVEVGLRIARCLAAAAKAMQLKDISRAAGIPAAKAHRYLVSMARAGLVEQDAETGLYDLGPLALELGIAALGRLDVVELAAHALRRLRDQLNETVLLSIWGSHGPTVVRWLESSQAVIVNVRPGSVLRVLTSASGLCFLAYLPPAITRPFVDAELADPTLPYTTQNEVQALIQSVRKRGLARVIGGVVPGIAGLGAPIFNEQGEIEGVFATLGPDRVFDADFRGPPARAVRTAADELSHRLGYRGPLPKAG